MTNALGSVTPAPAQARDGHTPGPWSCINEDSPGVWLITAQHPTAGTVSHAEVRSGCDEANELGDMLANARLIAAAPAMYEALKNWLAMADASIRDLGVDPHPDELAVINRARAALALAGARS